ncbi:MAG TPA: tetratricopeptide repeat protein [Spirochaetia bacterium]|nr:tetratricopeptide repeat protein [Spirochaetaceae bacterium]HPE88268.1 tetratricopeptide repeat protein [Spirochaetales bacterium]HRW23059.1 tetratricopeptide repeat protein [Spirochaetia bacterium]
MDESEPIQSRASLERAYKSNAKDIGAILNEMVARIQGALDAVGLFPAYKHRVKSFQSYFAKKIKFTRDAVTNGAPPLPITDLIAVRIICPFIGDLERVEKALSERFVVREVERKGSERSFKEFGYESTHLLLEIPEDVLAGNTFIDPSVCEVQIRTILQDAWAEVEHELVYKAEFTPFDDPMKRKLAALNANLTLSDMLFQEIRDYQHQLTNELAKRRVAFFKKIEDAIDKDMYTNFKETPRSASEEPKQPSWLGPWKSLDDLLLEALNAHNRADYIRAIDIYSHILALNPKPEIRALIYKHRGMAFFAESRYDEALEDFTATLELDGKCYKAAYYRGVVHSVKQNYSAAIDDFNDAVAIHPYHFYSTYRRAQAYYHVEDYPKALADCDAALELEPENESLKKLKRMVLKKLKM